MAHAGFPNGVGTTPEEVCKSIATNNDENRLHIIEVNGTPIGEMSYGTRSDKEAGIGIKICDFSQQEKGLGTTLITMFIDALFTYYGYDKIWLDTNTKNTRAQHVYEKKLGFKVVCHNENAWKDQLGEWQSSIDYELYKNDWSRPQNFNYIHIRQEQERDHYAVESITRDAFWFTNRENDGSKICDEHLLTHKLRNTPSLVPELNLVAELNGDIAGHIIYTISKIIDEHGTAHEMLTFGPLTVTPDYQNRGIGKALMRHSFKIAKELGHKAVIIYGHPHYYPRVGFRRAAEFGLTTADGKTFDPFMAYPLYNGALDGIRGSYHIDPVYDTLTQEDALEFDKKFPPKPQHIPLAIDVLLDRLQPPARDAIQALNFHSLAIIQTKSEGELLALPGIDATALETIRIVMRENSLPWGESKENRINALLDRAKNYKYSSMNYIEPTACKNACIIHDNNNLIFLHDTSTTPAMLYFATNNFNLVIDAISKLSGELRIHFVPREFAPKLESLGFIEWGEFVDFFNKDLPSTMASLQNIGTIEYLKPDECEEAAELSQKCKLQSRGFEGETPQWYNKWLNENCIIVQRKGSKIVGFCCVSVYNKGTTLWIRELAVDPAYQGMGYGKKLVEHAIAYGVQNGASKGFLLADVLNKNAISLYNRYNFHATNEGYELQMVRKGQNHDYINE